MTAGLKTENPSALDRYFHITERGSTVSGEIRAGVVTFFAMAYIVILNPLIIGTTPDVNGTTLGIPQVAAATALAAGVMTIASASSPATPSASPRAWGSIPWWPSPWSPAKASPGRRPWVW